jgi:hypothetical protein
MGRAEARVLLEKPMPISVRKETGYDTKHDVSRKTVWEAIEKYGRPVRARTADLHRVNCVVRKLNPFACLAFPVLTGPKRA